MGKKNKLLKLILSGSKNIDFSDFLELVKSFGFTHERTKGSHNIFKHSKVHELLNLQNENGKVKPYQTKQFLSLVSRYNLRMEDTDQ